MIRIISLYILFLFFPGNIIAQLPHSYHVSHYTTDNGLPSNGIKGIQWDEKTGFLWIATEAGISRFNGADFKNFTRENTPFISSERMIFMIRNSSGKIYTADLGKNIIAVQKNHLTRETRFTATQNVVDENLFTLLVSDYLFQYKIAHQGKADFNINSNKILPLTDTSCIIISFGKVYYYAASLNTAMRLPFFGIQIKTGFKIGNDCFFISDNNELYLFNPTLNNLAQVFSDKGDFEKLNGAVTTAINKWSQEKL